MADWLSGGVAAITGAGSGIGAALAQDLARRGLHLALSDRNVGALEAVAALARASGVKVTTSVFDVTDRAACDAWPLDVLAAHGRVTVLVNNAGVALAGTFQQVSAADFDWLMDINFHAPVRLTRAFLPLLAREPAAQLVNMSSIFGIIAPPQQTAYCAAKFALRGFSQSLRHELLSEGSTVGVTVVHPGGVDTAIASSARRPVDAKPQDVEMLQKAWKALPKLAPEEAARVIGDAIARRAPRVLVGPDAKRAAVVERLSPVAYWKFIGPALARAIAKA